MDEFVFDLDKALDDLEESEDKEQQCAAFNSHTTCDVPQEPSAPLPDYTLSYSIHNNQNGIRPYAYDDEVSHLHDYSTNRNTAAYELDMSDADFAPSVALMPKQPVVDQNEIVAHVQNGDVTQSLSHDSVDGERSGFPSDSCAATVNDSCVAVDNDVVPESELNNEVYQCHLETPLDSIQDTKHEDLIISDAGLCTNERTFSLDVHPNNDYISEQLQNLQTDTEENMSTLDIQQDGLNSDSLVLNICGGLVKDSLEISDSDHCSISHDIDMATVELESEVASETIQHTSLPQDQPISLTAHPTDIDTKSDDLNVSVTQPAVVKTMEMDLTVPSDEELASGLVESVKTNNRLESVNVVVDGIEDDNSASSRLPNEDGESMAVESSDAPMVEAHDMCTDVDVTGFSDVNDLDLSTEDDLEQYLSTIGGPGNYSEFDAKPSFAEEMKIVDYSHMSLSENSTRHVVDENVCERRSSDGSVEKFLVPMVMSPGITTPIDDPGYAKVPGYMTELSTTIEEEIEEGNETNMHNEGTYHVEENPRTALTESVSQQPNPHQAILRTPNVDSAIVSNEIGIGARPKEPTGRISRPNSLLGLSTPDLPTLISPQSNIAMELPVVAKVQPMVSVAQIPSLPFHPAAFVNIPARDSGIVADSGEIDSGASSPNETANTRNMHDLINTRKKNMNIEIKQNFPEEQQVDNRYQADVSTEDTRINNTQRPMFLSTGMPSLNQAAPVTVQGTAPSTLLLPSGGEATSQDPEQMALPGGPSVSVLGSSPRLKRPSSLNIIPQGDEHLGQDWTPTADVALEASSPMGTLATGEVATGGAESPMDNMQDISLNPQIGAVGPLGLTEAASAAPPTSANINLAITQLGKVAPVWVPDAEAPACMQCDARFTFTKRRHHCRACGKVFCNGCCNLRSRLVHMENKDARVCSKCYQDLIRAQVYERMHQPNSSPNPNNPSEYCSTVPPLQQAAGTLNAPPPTVMVPSSVLRKDGNLRRSVEGPKQVMFSDGIRPGGDLTELDGVPDNKIASQRQGRKVRRIDKSEDKSASLCGHTSRDQHKSVCLIPDQGLPPVLLSTGVKGDFSIEEKPDPEQILPRIRSKDDPEPVVFAINKNLFVLVKILTLDCCVNRICWCFTTKGMCTVGQDEIVIVLECLPDEKTVPRDIFCHLHAVYEEASKGNTVSHLGHTIFAQGFLDCRDHSGFLYINATYQCLQKLILPSPPYIFGILLQRWETPWAKVFPIRLLLRMGAEYRYYPCPLISVRFRKPVFGEIGHTIMNLLADFRNYQYMLPQIPGVALHMEDKQTYVNFPRNRYNNIMKVLTNSNDHVMALAANFSLKADSHLVCIQNDDGSYQTQAINIQNKPRQVTGASFVVFNGAFKQTGGLRAKSSIVEDGLMVQITAEMMVDLKESMRNMIDFCIRCGDLDIPAPEESVTVRWVDDDVNVNIGVKSPVDGMGMDGKESIRIHTATDFVGEKHTIRWTECFFIRNQMDSESRCEPVDLSRLAESLAQATCIALTPQLSKLQEAHLTKIGLRTTIDPDKTCYEVGSNGVLLPPQYMDVLDNALISVIHNAAAHNRDGPVILELIFHVIE